MLYKQKYSFKAFYDDDDDDDNINDNNAVRFEIFHNENSVLKNIACVLIFLFIYIFYLAIFLRFC